MKKKLKLLKKEENDFSHSKNQTFYKWSSWRSSRISEQKINQKKIRYENKLSIEQ